MRAFAIFPAASPTMYVGAKLDYGRLHVAVLLLSTEVRTLLVYAALRRIRNAIQ